MKSFKESMPSELFMIENHYSKYYHRKSAIKGVLTRLRQQHKKSWRKNEPYTELKVWVADVVNWREVVLND